MKKHLLITVSFFASAFITIPAFAQEANRADQKITAKSNLTNDRICVIKLNPSETGCDIIFNYAVKSPRDAANGQATGRRTHDPFICSVNSADNSVSEIKSLRDAGSGMATGRRSHGKASLSDFSVMMTIKGKSQKIAVADGEFSLPADCPNGTCDMILSWSWGASNGGSSKRCVVSFTATIEDGVCMAINEKGHANVKG